MDTYPCPACGGVADETNGCRSCGRPHNPVAATLARLNQRLAGLDEESRRLADNQSGLLAERARLQAEAESLKQTLVQQLTAETKAEAKAEVTGAVPPSPRTRPQRTPTSAVPPEDLARGSIPPHGATPRGSTAPQGATRPRTVPRQAPPPPPASPLRDPALGEPPLGGSPPGGPPLGGPPLGGPPLGGVESTGLPPETSPRSAQNTLLSLGGVLLGIAAVVFTALFYTTSATGGRAFILGVSTMLALGVPLLLTRRTLTATAETIAAFGLLLVLLDGYAAYSVNLAGIRTLSPTLFSAVLFGLVAAVAAAYRLASHLRAPQFAALLAVQPFLPLIAADRNLGRDGFAAVFAVVAALNLGSAELLSRDISRAIARVRLPGAAPGPAGQLWPRRLRELAWVLCGLTLAISLGLVVVGLVQADTVGAALRSSLVLLLAVAVGVAAGWMSRRAHLAHLASGAAVLAIIAAASRINALALPQFTLVLTATLAAAIAVSSGLLPESARRGPALGSLLGAALTAIVVIVNVVGTMYATVRAAVTPRIWMADLAGYADHVRSSNWQVPAAAVLLAILATVAAPAGWRLDAVVVGGFVIILALPGTAALAWWVVPLLACAGSIAATGCSLVARHGHAALVRSSVAGLLGMYAVATGLARAQLTAAVCTVLTVVAAGVAVLVARWPGRFGAHAERVADSAVGAAAFTLPIAVGTFASLAHAPKGVLVPLTLLATAAGVLGAALSQVAGRAPRTGGAGGALAASVGAVLLAVRVPGEFPDLGLAAVLVAAAGTTAAARAFEVSGAGFLAGLRAAPAAVSALVDEFDGVVDRPEPRPARRLRLDGTTAAAALATGALILAMARVAAVAVPGIGLVTTTTMVLVVALGVRALPVAWRRGPRLGSAVVGGTIAVVTAGVSVTEAARAVAAATPFWSADIAGWTARVSAVAPYGWQTPASLTLAAAASWALLPRPAGGDVGFVTLSLAGLSVPAVFGLAWWSPAVIAGAFAVLAGLGAALVTTEDPPGTHWRRLGLAGALGLYGTAAGSAAPASTAIVLSAIVAAGVLVAALAQAKATAPPAVPGIAAASALAAGPGAAAALAVASETGRPGILGSALAMIAFGVFVVAALRVAAPHWGGYPAFGVGVAGLIVAVVAALPDPEAGQVWAAAAALVASVAAAVSRMSSRSLAATATTSAREITPIVVTTAVPAALLAALASMPAWLTALAGPYRTLRQVWAGYAIAPLPRHAVAAVATLALLTGVSASLAIALGGRRYLFAAVLPPVAAAALVLPTAMDAPRAATPWVALAVALGTGLGAALSRPTGTSATSLLRGTASTVCALAGGAGVAGSLATRHTTLSALGIVLAAALVAATLGRDPVARTAAWIVAAAAGFALPPTVLTAAGRDVRPSAFGVLVVCAGLVAVGWQLGRSPARRAEAPVVELCAALGATFALLLSLGSARHAAAVLTIWGLLLGAAALRRDRPARWRHWLVRAALAAELAACWLLLYTVQIGLTEAYTLPFAAVALLAGALELRRRPDLSSWMAYGPALAGGFLPSLALIVVGPDPPVWRWVTAFLAAVAAVIIGSWRGRQAPAVTGAGVAMVIAVTQMIRLFAAGQIFGAVLVALAGTVLIVFGAISETRLRGVRRMS